MSDLVERLRKEAEIAPHEVFNWLNPLLTEAANEIERLQKIENAFARGDLKGI